MSIIKSVNARLAVDQSHAYYFVRGVMVTKPEAEFFSQQGELLVT